MLKSHHACGNQREPKVREVALPLSTWRKRWRHGSTCKGWRHHHGGTCAASGQAVWQCHGSGLTRSAPIQIRSTRDRGRAGEAILKALVTALGVQGLGFRNLERTGGGAFCRPGANRRRSICHRAHIERVKAQYAAKRTEGNDCFACHWSQQDTQSAAAKVSSENH